MESKSHVQSAEARNVQIPGNTTALATMNTNTTVTNSPLAATNPTAVPCGQHSNSPGSTNSNQQGHPTVQVIASRPATTLITGGAVGALPVLFEPPSGHRKGLLGPASVLKAVALPGTRETHTLPRNNESSLQSASSIYRHIPILAGAQPAGRLTNLGHNNPTYQMLTYPSSTTAVAALPSQPGPAGKSVQVPSVLVAGFAAATGDDHSQSAHRLTQILTPIVTIPSVVTETGTQLFLYYPQHTALTVKTPPVPKQVNEETTVQQQPTVYYAMASSDILRQLQHSAPQSSDSSTGLGIRAQLVQTSTGLMLLQHAGNLQKGVLKLPTTGQSLVATKLETTVRSSCDPESSVKSGRPERETFHQSTAAGGGLICTCPPEVHQAIFEQQQRRQKQLTQQAAANKGQNTDTAMTGRPQQNGCPTRSCREHLDEDSHNQHYSVRIASATHMVSKSKSGVDQLSQQHQQQTRQQQQRTPPTASIDTQVLTIEERTEKEAHVNYLCTLFQALKASGVQSESFLQAFQRSDISVFPVNRRDMIRFQAIIDINRVRVSECRAVLVSLKQTFRQFRQRMIGELKCCQNRVAQFKSYQRTSSIWSNQEELRDMRRERLDLDQRFGDLFTTVTSIVEQIHDLECVVEETGNDVLQHRCRITLPYVQTLDSRLDLINHAVGSTYAPGCDLKHRLTAYRDNEAQVVDVEARLLNEQFQQLEEISEKCKRIKGTILTLKRLAVVNTQSRQRANSPRRFTHIGGMVNRAAADANSMERTRLYASIRSIQPDSERRMQAIEHQETMTKQRKRVFATETNHFVPTTYVYPQPITHSQFDGIRKSANHPNSPLLTTSNRPVPIQSVAKIKQCHNPVTTSEPPTSVILYSDEKRTPLTGYCDDSTAAVGRFESWSIQEKTSRPANYVDTVPVGGLHDPDHMIYVMDGSNETAPECTPNFTIPPGILKSSNATQPTSSAHTNMFSTTSPRPSSRLVERNTRGVMFNTTVTVDDGSEVVRLNCTLDESELSKPQVPPTDTAHSTLSKPGLFGERMGRLKVISDKHDQTSKTSSNKSSESTYAGSQSTKIQSATEYTDSQVGKSKSSQPCDDQSGSGDGTSTAPEPPPRKSSQVGHSLAESDKTTQKLVNPGQSKQDYENVEQVSPTARNRQLPLSISLDASKSLVSPNE